MESTVLTIKRLIAGPDRPQLTGRKRRRKLSRGMLCAFTLAAFVAAPASAQSRMEIYTGSDDAPTSSFATDDIANVKFVDQKMRVNFRDKAGAPADSPFEVATAEVMRVKFNTNTSAVECLDAEIPDLSPICHYNLQGFHVTNPQPGTIYIRVQGKNIKKVIY